MHTARPLPRKGFAALIAGATGIGFAPIFVRLSEIGPDSTAFYRLLVAVPVLWLWKWRIETLEPGFRRPAGFREFGLLALAGFFFAGDMVFWHRSLKLTTVTNSTFFNNFAPFFVMFGARFFFGEKITRSLLAGLFMAFCGGALLIAGSLSLNPKHLAGDALSLFTALFYAGYLLTIKQLRRSFHTSTIMAWSGLVTCPILFLVAAVSGESFVAVSWQGWMVLVALGLLSHAGGQGMIAYAMAHLAASFSAVALLWQPVVAAVLAMLVLGEPLGFMQIAGGLVIIAGIVTASRSQWAK